MWFDAPLELAPDALELGRLLGSLAQTDAFPRRVAGGRRALELSIGSGH